MTFFQVISILLLTAVFAGTAILIYKSISARLTGATQMLFVSCLLFAAVFYFGLLGNFTDEAGVPKVQRLISKLSYWGAMYSFLLFVLTAFFALALMISEQLDKRKRGGKG